MNDYHPDEIVGISLDYLGYSKVASRADRRFQVRIPVKKEKIEKLLKILNREGVFNDE